MTAKFSVRTAPLLMALALPIAAFAQTATPAQPTESASPAPGSDAEKRVDRRLEMMHSKLKITQAQEPAWQEFAAARRHAVHDMQQWRSENGARMSDQSALDRMRAWAAISQARAQEMQITLPAFEKLYAELSPEQKQTTDQMFRRFAHREHRFEHHRQG